MHQAYTNAAAQVVSYTDEPYLPDCGNGEFPDITDANIGDGTYGQYEVADGELSIIQHELLEAITDPAPDTANFAFGDQHGSEIGDHCNAIFGKPLGFTNALNPGISAYNVVMNGDKYYVQLALSNKSYASAGDGRGCIPGAFGSPTAKTAQTVTAHDGAGSDSVGSVTVDSSRSDLPADGVSTATITVTVTDRDGNPLPGDHINFNASDANQGAVETIGGTEIDSGQCGTVNSADPDSPDTGFTTNDSGQVFATYTTSTTNGSCSILATEVMDGTANDTIVFQGSSDQEAPSLTQSTPTSVTAGGSAITFTTTAQNPGVQNIYDTTQTLYLSGDDNGTTGLDANDVTVSYADGGTDKQFVSLTPTGTTANGGYIEIDLDPGAVVDYPAGAGNTVTFKLAIAKTAADSAATGAPLTLDSEFNQLNLASGASTNLSFDYGSAFVVPAKADATPPIVVTTPVSTVTTIYQPIRTIIESIPGPAAKPALCIAPNLLGKNVAEAQAALKKAHCTNVTLLVPATKKGQKVVFSVEAPTRGHHVAMGANLRATFRIVKIAKR